MESANLNDVTTYAPKSREALIDYAMDNKSILVAVNAEKILHATEETRSIINRNVGYPDGIGAVWALKKKGFRDVVKIPGCELWLDIVAAHYNTKSFYFIGGKQDVIEQVVEKLQKNFNGINILNFRNGYINSDEEEQQIIDDIALLKPDIVFVAMGSPKQELFMEKICRKHNALYQGLGGSFDVYVGNVKRAPKWWVKNNLEWAYRLLKQPSRIKRQIHLLKFLFNLTLKRY